MSGSSRQEPQHQEPARAGRLGEPELRGEDRQVLQPAARRRPYAARARAAPMALGDV